MFIPGFDFGALHGVAGRQKPISLFQSKPSAGGDSIISTVAKTIRIGGTAPGSPGTSMRATLSRTTHGSVILIAELVHILLIVETGSGNGQKNVSAGHG
jgi:hypothetical protein